MEKEIFELKDDLDFNCEMLRKGLGTSSRRTCMHKGVEIGKPHVILQNAFTVII